MIPAPVITIDGPSGVGKGTLAQALARRYAWHYLDSGALYRAFACWAMRHDYRLEQEDELIADLDQRRFEVRISDETQRVQIQIDDLCFEDELRTPACAQAASRWAAQPRCRAWLLEQQRSCHRPPGLVTDGRDMGTVIFPEADCKLFLTASAHIRAKRRYQELKALGSHVSLEALVLEIQERDRRDRSRQTSPLKPAEDATIIDTSNMSLQAVEQAAHDCVRAALGW